MKLEGITPASRPVLAAVVSTANTIIAEWRSLAKLADGLLRAAAPDKSKKTKV